MASAILRMVYIYKYRAHLSTHYQEYLYRLNRHHRSLQSHLLSLRFRVAEVFFKHSHPFRPHYFSRPSYHNHEVPYLLQTENGRRLWCCAAQRRLLNRALRKLQSCRCSTGRSLTANREVAIRLDARIGKMQLHLSARNLRNFVQPDAARYTFLHPFSRKRHSQQSHNLYRMVRSRSSLLSWSTSSALADYGVLWGPGRGRSTRIIHDE
jgi:hypothetical protein